MARKPLKRSLTQKVDNDNLVIGLRSVVPKDRVDLFEDEFRRFGAKRFPRALQYVANRVAADAKKLLGEAIDRVVDRPVALSRVNDKGRSSILTRGRSLNGMSDSMDLSEVRADVYVQDKQSSWFKYLLGERIRRPGDVGPSEDHITVPVWSNLTRLQGIHPTAEGNLPRNAIGTLKRRQARYSLRNIAGMGEKEGRALKRNRKRDAGHHTTFFGRPRGVFGDAVEGWWDRPEVWRERTGPVITTGPNKGRKKFERKSDGRPRMLALALPYTEHDPILAKAWDEAVIKAAGNFDRYMTEGARGPPGLARALRPRGRPPARCGLL